MIEEKKRDYTYVGMGNLLKKLDAIVNNLHRIEEDVEYFRDAITKNVGGIYCDDNKRILSDFVEAWIREREDEGMKPLDSLLEIPDAPIWKKKLMEINQRIEGKNLKIIDLQSETVRQVKDNGQVS